MHSTVKSWLSFLYISHGITYSVKNQDSLINNSILISFEIVRPGGDNAHSPYSRHISPSPATATWAKCVVRDPMARRDLGICGKIIGSAMGNIAKKAAYGNNNVLGAQRAWALRPHRDNRSSGWIPRCEIKTLLHGAKQVSNLLLNCFVLIWCNAYIWQCFRHWKKMK